MIECRGRSVSPDIQYVAQSAASAVAAILVYRKRGSSLEVWNFKQSFESEGFLNYLGGSGIDSFPCWMNPINPLSSNHPSPKPLFPNSQA